MKPQARFVPVKLVARRRSLGKQRREAVRGDFIEEKIVLFKHRTLSEMGFGVGSAIGAELLPVLRFACQSQDSFRQSLRGFRLNDESATGA